MISLELSWLERLTHGRLDGRSEGRTDGRTTARQTDGRTDRWEKVGKRTEEHVYLKTTEGRRPSGRTGAGVARMKTSNKKLVKEAYMFLILGP